MLLILGKKMLPFFSVICLLCLAFNVNGQTITISPSLITVEMIGGDVLTRNLTFSHDGASDMACNISFEILPEGEGINVSFSVGDSFVLKPGNTFIAITINVSHRIMPGTYTINVYANAEGHVPDEKGESGSKRGSNIIIVEPVDDSATDTDDDSSDPADETVLLDDEPPESDPTSSWVSKYIPTILISIFITLFVTLLVLWNNRRKKKNET